VVKLKVKMDGGAEGVSKVDETFDEVEESLNLTLCPLGTNYLLYL